jgi:hypothetical protein
MGLKNPANEFGSLISSVDGERIKWDSNVAVSREGSNPKSTLLRATRKGQQPLTQA